jgi:hypothetical protein
MGMTATAGKREPSTNGQALPLAPGHLAKCRESGLSDETIRANKIHTVADPSQVNRHLNWKRGGEKLGQCLAFPYGDGYVRLRPSTPRTDKKENKTIKYESPKGQPNRAYFPHGIDAALTDPAVPLAITEGELKALCLSQNGIPTIGLTGVCGWQVKRERDAEGQPSGERRLIPDLDSVKWEGRVVFIIFDSDSATNENVQLAEKHLAEALTAKGATVRIVRIPPGPNSEKMGADDYIVANGADAMRQLLLRAESGAAAAKPKRESSATRLVNEAKKTVSLFHDPDRTAYITFPAGEHRETHAINSKPARLYLRQLARRASKGKSISDQALREAIADLEAVAIFDCPETPVFTRVAEHQGNIYYDLANEKWEVVEISDTGWRVVAEAPVKFRRAKGVAALPTPVKGSVDALRPHLNVATDADYQLAVAWLLAAMRPRGPYPSLAIHGEQGSAKSTASRVLRALADPSTSPVRSEPRDPRDLIIAATNSWVVCLDNLSHLPAWLSDCLCRLATGGGFSTRALYTDQDEIIFDAMRPTILNGISELAVRPDLQERSIILTLPTIPEAKRKTEREFWREFNAVKPEILGGLFAAIADGLKHLPSVEIKSKPRMADFAEWAVACEPGLGWQAGSFLAAYQGNIRDANDIALDAAPVVPFIRQLVERGPFTGTTSELLAELTTLAGEKAAKDRHWPKSPQAIGATIARLAPNLRRSGIDVETWREKDRRRTRKVHLRKRAEPMSATSDMSETAKNPADNLRTYADDPMSSACPHPNPAKTGLSDVADVADNDLQPLSSFAREPGDDPVEPEHDYLEI